MSERNLKSIAAEMSVIDPALRYYSMTMTVDIDGNDHTSTQTYWAGWADEQRRTELRVPSLVNPEAIVRYWDILKQPYLVVNKEEEWFVYFCLGGNALVEENIAETFLAGTFAQMRTEGAVRSRNGTPFLSLSALPKHAVQRAPTPKLRMEVLTRDNRRCRICGSSPATNEHVELHVHHIRPWEDGGHTYLDNLITLCHTCHKGLDPHHDDSLFDLLPPRDKGDTHAEGVRRYRERIWREIVNYENGVNKSAKRRMPQHHWKRRGRRTLT